MEQHRVAIAKPSGNGWLRWLLAWLPMVLIAIANGALRDLGYGSYLGELRAQQLSTITGIVLFGFYIRFVVRALRPESAARAAAIGALWLVMTIVFEFVFGHWVAAEMITYGVKPEIEAFDLSMIFQAVTMAHDGRIKAPLHVQFVMGVKNAMPVDRESFEFYVKTLARLAPDATWTGAGIGGGQRKLAHWSLELGGHCRTGLEDNIRLDKDQLAPSNAALVTQVADLCAQYARRVATVAEARQLLSLPAVPNGS